ncbi:hypothetical protein T265_12813, partial [Opisthorchis viverrini]
MNSKAIVKNVDMDKQMERHALELCADAMKRFDLEKDIASHIKKDFERKYGPTWHCIVGRSYGRWVRNSSNKSRKKNRSVVAPFRCLPVMPPEGCTRAGILSGCPRGSREVEVGFEPETFRFVTHEPGSFIYFFLDKFAVLLFKSG